MRTACPSFVIFLVVLHKQHKLHEAQLVETGNECRIFIRYATCAS